MVKHLKNAAFHELNLLLLSISQGDHLRNELLILLALPHDMTNSTLSYSIFLSNFGLGIHQA